MMRTLVAAALAVAATAQSWSITSSASVGQGIAGASCFDSSTCVVSGSDGFLGYDIYLSQDGGKTWASVPNQGGYLFPLIDASTAGTAAVVAGQFSCQFSLNSGAFFNSSIGGAGGSVTRVLGSNAGFALVGLFGSTNGVSTSSDFGITFGTAIDAQLQTDASFGAFPTSTTWYVTGATVPPSGNDQTTTPTTGSTTSGTSTGSTTPASAPAVTVSHITKRMSIVHTRGGRARHVFETPAVQTVSLRGGRHLQSNNTGYSAQIVKTTDGGNTWTSQYYSTGLFALNGIDCRDGNNCCAVAEAATGPAEGAYIMCTADGTNWATTYNSTNAGDSLVDIRAVGASEYWAVGGNIGSTSISASFLHSTDNGKTWTVDTSLPNYFGTGIDCVAGSSPAFCVATLVDTNDNGWIATN